MERGYSGDVDEAPSTALRSSHCNVSGRRRSSAASQYSRLTIARKPATEPPVNSLMMSMYMVVLLYVQLKYDGKKEGVFEDNPVPVWCSLIAFCVYRFIVTKIKQMPKPDDGESLIHEILERAANVSAVFSIVSLLSIFLPNWISFFLLLTLPPLLVTLAWPALCHAYNLLPEIHAKVIMRIIWYWITSTVVDYFHDKVVSWTRGNNFTQKASLPT